MPVLVDLKPPARTTWKDFHQAGGLTPVLRELAPASHLDALTVDGRSLGEIVEAAVPDLDPGP